MKVNKREWDSKKHGRRARWYVDFIDKHSGERVRENLPAHIKGERAANEAAARLFADREANPALEKASEVTLALEELLEAHRGRPLISASTREMERNQGAQLVAKFGSSTPTSRIEVADLDDYVSARLMDPRGVFKRKDGTTTETTRRVGGATILKELKLLNQALRWGQSRGLAVRDPFADLPQVTVEKKRPRCLTREEMALLLDACGPDTAYLRQAAEFCYLSGLRRAELFRLQWREVDFAGNLIRFITMKRGRSPKRMEDVVYLPKRALDLLRLRREALGKPGQTALVFGTLPRVWAGVESTVDQTFADALEAAARRAGIARPKEIGAHTLRHSCATHLLEAGVPVSDAAAHLRHRDGGALLLRTYAHVFEKGLRRAACLLAGESLEAPVQEDPEKMSQNVTKNEAKVYNINKIKSA